MSINCKIQLKGNLGQEPKTITPENGKEFVVLSVATIDSYKDKSGAWKNKQTQWHEVVLFKPVAAKFAKALKKGDRILIEGTLSYKQIETKEGHKVLQVSILGTFIAKAPLAAKANAE